MGVLLVVDDDPQMLEMLCVMLQRSHRIVRASSATAALSILDSTTTPIDLLLTDVVMPGVNGFSLARMARERRPRLKILYLSGASDTTEAMRDPGARHGKVLNKAISALDLIMEVERALAA